MIDVRQHGAVGDGAKKDTAALQQALDACAGAGGGTVLVPPGVYLCGTLFLRSHVRLKLDQHAVIKGSPDRSDYNDDDIFVQNEGCAREKVSGAHLIIAHELEDVAIEGPGVIDGNGRCFFGAQKNPPPDSLTWRYPVFEHKDWRPGQMVWFCECRHVRVQDVRLVNSPHWTLFLHGCEDVRANGLHIYNDRRGHTGDGIDIDSCRDVIVGNCRINTCDDGITLRGNNRRLKNPERRCENIAVSNCVITSRASGIRVGVGNGVIRNAVFSNIVMENTPVGINIISRYSSTTSGTAIENIRFDNFIMETDVPFVITTGYDARSPVRNLYFSNIRATASSAGYIGGNAANPLDGIYFDNVEVEFSGGRLNRPDVPAPAEIWKNSLVYCRCAAGMPCGFFIEHVQNIFFRRFSMRWGATDGLWQQAFRLADVCNVTFDGVSGAMPAGKAVESFILLQDTDGVSIRNSSAAAPLAVFVMCRPGARNGKIKLINNDFSNVPAPVMGAADVLAAGNLNF